MLNHQIPKEGVAASARVRSAKAPDRHQGRLFAKAKTSVVATSVGATRLACLKKKIERDRKAPDVVTARGQHERKIDGADEPARAPSVANLHADARAAGAAKIGARPKKAASRDRIDRIGHAERRSDKRGLATPKYNNNKFDNEEVALDSFQEIESLRHQLNQMAAEKSSLALELGEQKGHIHSLQHQIEGLKLLQEQSTLQMEQLTEENTLLRNRLRNVAHSPLSDNEKQQLLFETHRHHSSAPASIATNVADDGGEATTCPTPEWDKHSSSNVSEVSVACLQDKINQMQETHYSTNEELQATLQELTDLQRQLSELQQENERLLEEKNLMFDSLCRQTERLKDSRGEIESLKQLLYRDDTKDDDAQAREQKLVELLKSAQEEQSASRLARDRLEHELAHARAQDAAAREHARAVADRNATLESQLDAKHAEHRRLDRELALARDQSSGRQIEIDRLGALLENARARVGELEQDRAALGDKSELDEMLDNARKEKDVLESEVARLREQLARGKNEAERLREQVSILQEECKVLRNNAKTTQSDLEYAIEKLRADKAAMAEQLRHFQDAVNELQVQAQCQSEDKRNLSDVLAETQRTLSESEQRIASLEGELADVKRLRSEENEEWEKFQNDLLTSVRVANDFKTEAQQDLQKMIMENKEHRDKVRQLEAQLDKLKETREAALALRPSSFPGDEMAARRNKICLSRQSSRQSVKSLIESIENAGKPVLTKTAGTVSRSNSTSSLNSLSSELRTPASPSTISPASPLWSDKTPLKEQQPAGQVARDWAKLGEPKAELPKGVDYSRRNSYSDERKDPLNGLAKNGGSRRNALLKWCQNKTVGYRNIDITNFSSSWNDGLALCALLHTYIADRIPYDSLTPNEKRRNFTIAFAAAESVGIPTTLNINDMVQLERPDWQQVMGYVTTIYKHFET